MKKILILGLVLLLGTTIVSALELNFTFRPSNFLGFYYDLEDIAYVPGPEIGILVAPQVEITGNFSAMTYVSSYGYDDKGIALTLGARYNFPENKAINPYLYGNYSFPFLKEDGEAVDFTTNKLSLGFGLLYKINKHCAIIGETGIVYDSYSDPDPYSSKTLITTNSVGIRFYL